MKRLLFLVFASLAAHNVPAQKPGTASSYPVSPVAQRQLDSLYRYLDTSGLFNGTIEVASGGQRVSGAAIGLANLTTMEHLTEGSAFELASLSKQFTAVGILTLVQAGKLQLDQQLQSIFPTLPYTGVTIRNLLNHTSGIPDYIGLFMRHWDRKRIATNNDVVALLTRYHPDQEFSAGSKWEYSNTGYALLAAVIERVSGKSYAQYMQEAVFQPLGLTHTFVYNRRYAPQAVPGYAYGYVEDGRGAFRLPDSIPRYDYVRYLDGICGDGTVNSTVGDLTRWNKAIQDGALLTPALWNEATSSTTVAGQDTRYGFGFLVLKSPTDGRILAHNGSWPGYQTRSMLYLDKGVSLVFLGNRESDPKVNEALYAAVHDIVFGQPFEFPAPFRQVAVKVDPELFKRYEGTYASSTAPDFAIAIRTKGKKLTAQATGQGVLKLTPESPTIFFVDGAPIRIEFPADGTGPAQQLILHQEGLQVFKRKGD